jgi:hypothetical protein
MVPAVVKAVLQGDRRFHADLERDIALDAGLPLGYIHYWRSITGRLILWIDRMEAER